jgi:outer membrane receptor protein involved in Fe transport
LIEIAPLTTTAPLAKDPRRGGQELGAGGAYQVLLGGNPKLGTTLAKTTSLGGVFTPIGLDGPRLALDYSHIVRTRDLLSLSADAIMANEDAWPERVTRAPLTDADRALGFTAGRVIVFDGRISNGASLVVDALDMHVSWPLTVAAGALRLYADATYQMHNVHKAPFQPDMDFDGYENGPLKWRANAGVDWSTNRLTIGANLQFFGHYLVLQQGPLSSSDALYVEVQGSRWVPSQAYLDLHATWRLPALPFAPADALTVDFGVVNVLDKAPPREFSAVFGGPGYSRYGDPRQRRFELGLSAHF